MNWFRSHIVHGSRLALLALAIQFVLSFGHFHGLSAQAAPAAAVQSIQAQQHAPKPASDHDTSDACAICAVIAMANAVLLSTPPLLELPRAVELVYLTTDAGFIHLNSARIAFQPRAPPIS